MITPRPLLAAIAAVMLAVEAHGVTLTLRSETKTWPGVTVRAYRTARPSANAWVALVDLCAANVHVDATRPLVTGNLTTASWAQGNGAALATNGDFYASPPLHVLGNAVGEGIPWPLVNTGLDPRYASHWSYRRYGWLAFTHDGVLWNHTKRVKTHANGRTLGGWSPGAYTDELPPGLLALVSGFPEVVTEGVQVRCTSPTAADCFPDRADMRARHPRTAMGITQDARTFILLVVDGRTSTSAGMYGAELAETMRKLGAWQAFNLDGGGSSQLWQKGADYRNDYDGNNHGSGARAVLNHWGVWAGSGNGKPARPGHCVQSPPCQLIPATGGTIDNQSKCFRAFGPAAYWHEESTGSGGTLYWTGASEKAVPSNWAWWRLELAAAGDYRVEYYANSTYGNFAKARYTVVADGVSRVLTVNQSRGSGWTALGTFHFAAGGGQFVRLDDNASPPVDPAARVLADAVRLVPVTPATGCGNDVCDAPEDCASCESDCGACPRCGDATCNGAETCATCAIDCGACCGNAICDPTETCATCAADCGPCVRCGDGACNGDESCATCAGDCGACCGDGECAEPETCATCERDCGPCARCGDLECNGDETCAGCAGDCGACPSCGDGRCDGAETCADCPGDCGACASCGDGRCEEGEGCAACASDCGECDGCGDGSCRDGETCATCELDCDRCENAERSDAGDEPDGGPPSVDAGQDESAPTTGCACTSAELPIAGSLLALVAHRRKRRR